MAHSIVVAGQSELCRADQQAGNSSTNWYSFEVELFLIWETSVFSLEVFSQLDETQAHDQG